MNLTLKQFASVVVGAAAFLASVVAILAYVFPHEASLSAYCVRRNYDVGVFYNAMASEYVKEEAQCKQLVSADIALNSKIGAACQSENVDAVNAAITARYPSLKVLSEENVKYSDFWVQSGEYCSIQNDGEKEASGVQVELRNSPSLWIMNGDEVKNNKQKNVISVGSIMPGSVVDITYLYVGDNKISATYPTNISYSDGRAEIYEGKTYYGQEARAANAWNWLTTHPVFCLGVTLLLIVLCIVLLF
ncbi:hypothetical protein [Burkholderia plantarii]|uniref:hypothetical protein n=1 Tax=Burkholderia plantarii TaxID=41899 RepID=UPI000A726327|nr:hypothetical protein [Burkholderia plantarii]GLZ22149.1 hypothetical protein Bpla01_56780 [Burkholderia plantarii]